MGITPKSLREQKAFAIMGAYMSDMVREVAYGALALRRLWASLVPRLGRRLTGNLIGRRLVRSSPGRPPACVPRLGRSWPAIPNFVPRQDRRLTGNVVTAAAGLRSSPGPPPTCGLCLGRRPPAFLAQTAAGLRSPPGPPLHSRPPQRRPWPAVPARAAGLPATSSWPPPACCPHLRSPPCRRRPAVSAQGGRLTADLIRAVGCGPCLSRRRPAVPAWAVALSPTSSGVPLA